MDALSTRDRHDGDRPLNRPWQAPGGGARGGRRMPSWPVPLETRADGDWAFRAVLAAVQEGPLVRPAFAGAAQLSRIDSTSGCGDGCVAEESGERGLHGTRPDPVSLLVGVQQVRHDVARQGAVGLQQLPVDVEKHDALAVGH